MIMNIFLSHSDIRWIRSTLLLQCLQLLFTILTSGGRWVLKHPIVWFVMYIAPNRIMFNWNFKFYSINSLHPDFCQSSTTFTTRKWVFIQPKRIKTITLFCSLRSRNLSFIFQSLPGIITLKGYYIASRNLNSYGFWINVFSALNIWITMKFSMFFNDRWRTFFDMTF